MYWHSAMWTCNRMTFIDITAVILMSWGLQPQCQIPNGPKQRRPDAGLHHRSAED
jgi:hypothetical protein